MCNKRNTFLYLKSNSGTYNNETGFFRWSFVNPIVARKNELINIRVAEAEIPVSYYNIDTTLNNNSFTAVVVLSDNSSRTFTKTISPGNYTASDLASQITAIADVTDYGITMTFSEITSKFSITIQRVSGSLDIKSILIADETASIHKVIGFDSSVSINLDGEGKSSHTEVASKVCDLSPSNNLYLETDLLLESRDTLGRKSGILSKIQIFGDFFSIVHFQNNSNEDITLDRKDTYLDHIDLRFVFEDTSKIINFNGAEFTITLLFSFIKKDALLLGDEITTDGYKPYIDTINQEDDECYYSDNEI